MALSAEEDKLVVEKKRRSASTKVQRTLQQTTLKRFPLQGSDMMQQHFT